MNKQMMFLALAVITSYLSLGQSIGIGTNSPHNSAILDINSNNKGMLTPRMTTAQRNVIAAPAKGLLVFDTDVNNFFYHNGTAWTSFSGAGISFPYTTTVNTVTQGFGIINAGSGAGLYGAATIGSGVYGRADAAGGKGITGIGFNGATGVLAYASPGLALEVNGNLKISGGNTNPSAGAVLTSDASGIAVWKNNKIAFSASGLHSSMGTMYSGTSTRIQFNTEEYDFGSNYKKVGDDPSPYNTSEFTAPVNGIYHFDALTTPSFYNDNTDSYSELRVFEISLHVWHNGSYNEVARSTEENLKTFDSIDDFDSKSYSISKDIRLQAGDKVHVQWYFRDKNAQQAHLSSFFMSNHRHFFNGHLVFAE